MTELGEDLLQQASPECQADEGAAMHFHVNGANVLGWDSCMTKEPDLPRHVCLQPIQSGLLPSVL